MVPTEAWLDIVLQTWTAPIHESAFIFQILHFNEVFEMLHVRQR